MKDVLKFQDGFLRPEGSTSTDIQVKGRSLIVTFTASGLREGVYADDLLAIVRDIIVSDPREDTYNVEAVKYIQKALEILDARAVDRHGYSGNKRERDYVPEYMKLK